MFDIDIFADLLDELGDDVDYYSYSLNDNERIIQVDIHDKEKIFYDENDLEECPGAPADRILKNPILVNDLYNYLEENAISKKGVKYFVGDFSVVLCRDSFNFE